MNTYLFCFVVANLLCKKKKKLCKKCIVSVLMVAFCCFQAQKLLLRDGTLANFTIQSSSTLPTITLGLPVNARVNTQPRYDSTELNLFGYFSLCVSEEVSRY